MFKIFKTNIELRQEVKMLRECVEQWEILYKSLYEERENSFDEFQKAQIAKLESTISYQKLVIENLEKNILKYSTCKTCHGDRGKTLGLCECNECGLLGDQVWPG